MHQHAIRLPNWILSLFTGQKWWRKSAWADSRAYSLRTRIEGAVDPITAHDILMLLTDDPSDQDHAIHFEFLVKAESAEGPIHSYFLRQR